MALKSSHFAVLQLGENVISLVRFKASSSGLAVSGQEFARGEWAADPESLGNNLDAFAKEHKLGEETIFTVLPRHDVTARIIELPSQDAAEIAGMVQLSAEEFVPYPADELVIDQVVLERLPEGSSKVFVAVAHRDVLNNHLKLLRSAGIDPEQIFLSTACLMAVAAAAECDESDCYTLVNLAAGGLEVLVVRRGTTEYSRGIPTHQDWSLPEDSKIDALEELRIEVRNSMTAHRRESEDGTGADQVYVCSEWAPLDAPAQFLAEELGYPAAPATFAMKLVESGVDTVSGVPLVALGAALTAQDRARIPINLLPKNVQRMRSSATARIKAIRVAVAAVLVIMLGTAAFYQRTWQKEAYIAYLEEQADLIRPHVRDLNVKRKHLERLQSQVARSGSVLELLAGIIDRTPAEDFNFSRFMFEHDRGITINGRATTLNAIERLPEELRAAATQGFPQFAAAREEYRQQAEERKQDIWTFEIQMEFPEPEESDDE